MEEGLPKVPKLELAQLKFVLGQELNPKTKSNKPANELKVIRDNLLDGIIKDSMYLIIQ